MKIKLEDLECYDEMYYVGHLVDVDGSGWVDEVEAQKLLDQINQPEPSFSDRINTPTLFVIVFLMMCLINGLMSCTVPKYTTSLITGSTRKMDKWDIEQIDRVRGWKYAQPEAQTMIPGTTSQYTFTSNK